VKTKISPKLVPVLEKDGKIYMQMRPVEEIIGVCILNTAGIKHSRFRVSKKR